MNNIYDLEGNVYELTIAAKGTSERVNCGGYYDASNAAIFIHQFTPIRITGAYGYRIVFYIT